MAEEQPTVSDIFRRAQEIRRQSPEASYKDIRESLLKDFANAQFPSADRLTIPEQDARAPEEDWTAGLPLVLRGIQQKDWKEIVNGIVLSLEQTENYDRARGGAVGDGWHDRSRGIEEQTEKAIGKWMPADLLAMAERQGKKQ